MKVQQFLAHYGVTENPFSPEDAQTDHIFRKFCLHATHHPAWDKIYGNPESPATSVVFGEKGSSKTALRLQMVDDLAAYNRAHPDRRCFVIEYDDFNPFLDAFRDRLHGRKRRADRMLGQWRLWDHMDAILSLGVTRLVRGVTVARDKAETERLDGSATATNDGAPIETRVLDRFSRNQKRDLLLLAAFYEHSYDRPPRPAIFDVAGQMGRPLGPRRHGRHDRAGDPLCRLGATLPALVGGGDHRCRLASLALLGGSVVVDVVENVAGSPRLRS